MKLLAHDRTAICDQLAGLAQIYEDDVNVCVLRRALEPALREAAQALAALGAAQARCETSLAVPDWNELLPARLSTQAREVLSAELNFLAELTGDLFGGESAGVRLSVSKSPPCPRFHVDRVHARLVTTWLGPGTEWIENRDCDRRWLGAASVADAERRLILNARRIQQAPEHAIVILKGEAWPEFQGRGAVHRSPPSTGLRVFVSLEPL